MIRPFTFVTLMLACTSGAYLFVVKHRAAGLDTQISSVTGQIRSAEQRIRVLQAEWALENDPSQLAALSKQFLKLKPMEPGQMTTLSRLAEILPPPGAGLPHLPLPPPPSWAMPAAPSGEAPVDNGAAGPVASATPLIPAPLVSAPLVSAPAIAASALTPLPMAAPVRLASAQPTPFIPSAPPIRHAAPAPKRMMAPARHSIHYAARHATHQVTVAAERAPVRMTPRFTAVPASYHQPYHAPAYAKPFGQTRSGGTQSVFGDLGANLPPPQPVSRTPQ